MQREFSLASCNLLLNVRLPFQHWSADTFVYNMPRESV